MTQELQHTTTANQLLTLDQKITEATDRLRPASADAIASRLLMLTRAGLQFPQGMDIKRAPEIYGFALQGLALSALKQVIEKIVSGQVDGITSFIPTPPALAVMVRKASIPMIEDVARLRETVRSIEDAKRAKFDEEDPELARQRGRIRELNAKFQQDHAAFKAAEEAEKPQMTEAQQMRFFRNKLPRSEEEIAAERERRDRQEKEWREEEE